MDPTENTLEAAQPSKVRRVLGRIGAVIACIPSAALILLGLYALVFGAGRLTWGSALLFFLLPGLVLFLLILLLRKPWGAAPKVILGLVLWGLLAVGVISFPFWSFFLPLETHSVSRENAAAQFAATHPSLALIQNLELSDPEEAAYHDCLRLAGMFFDTEAHALVCRYGEDYEAQKAALEASLPFREEPLESGDPNTGEKLQFDHDLRIGGDRFRFLEPGEGYESWFGKFCVLFVTNDETREIAFLVYDDVEVDYVTDITEFIEHDCCWKMIR